MNLSKLNTIVNAGRATTAADTSVADGLNIAGDLGRIVLFEDPLLCGTAFRFANGIPCGVSSFGQGALIQNRYLTGSVPSGCNN